VHQPISGPYQAFKSVESGPTSSGPQRSPRSALCRVQAAKSVPSSRIVVQLSVQAGKRVESKLSKCAQSSR